MSKAPHKAVRAMKERKEFEEEVLEVARVTRVVKGGRRLRFRTTVAIGNQRGKVGLGIGKAGEVSIAIKKAVAKAKRNLVDVPIVKGDTIPFDVRVKFKSAVIVIMPASEGTGIKAGSSIRKILALAGVKNVLSKSIGRTKNKINMAKATLKAFEVFRGRDIKGLKKVVADAPSGDLKSVRRTGDRDKKDTPRVGKMSQKKEVSSEEAVVREDQVEKSE